MLCPSCRSATLGFAELEGGLACQSCNECAGALVELSIYGRWVAQHDPAHAQPSPSAAFEAADSKRALCCPTCQRIMSKFKVAADAAHGLDFCFPCEKVWLDSGEWGYLGSLGLHTRIRSISTEPWQRRLREEASSKQRLALLKQAMGEDVFARVEDFRNWLAQQPRRDEILRYLSTAD